MGGTGGRWERGIEGQLERARAREIGRASPVSCVPRESVQRGPKVES